MNFLCLKEWDPSKSRLPNLTSNLFCGHKWERTTLKTGQQTVFEPRIGQDQLWFVDSGCSRHMTSKKANFLSLAATQGGSVTFGNGKSGTIVGIGKIGESLSNSIEDVYLVDGLKHNLLSVSQLCDKDSLVVFTSNRCLVVSMDIGDIMLRGKGHKNVYNVCISSLPQNTLTCLSALNDDAILWHKRPGHASLSLLNKLISKD